MAKTSKSAAVRELLAKYPDMPAKDIAAKAGVTPNLVYFIKAKRKATARKAKRQQLAAAGAGNAGNGVDVLSLLNEIKGLAAKAGGIKELKKFVDVLAD